MSAALMSLTVLATVGSGAEGHAFILMHAQLFNRSGHSFVRAAKSVGRGCSSAPAMTQGSSGPLEHPRVDAILSFWFGDNWAQPKPPGYWTQDASITAKWFKGGPEVDEHIRQHFAADVEALAAGTCDDWLARPHSALAGIVLADQFTRHIYRGTAAAFSLDHKALAWAKRMQDSGSAHELPDPMRYFTILPFMHSEDRQAQQRCVDVATAELEANRVINPDSAASKSWADVLRYAKAHQAVVQQYGRFPHRNALLGRQDTPQEAAGLAAGSIPSW